MTVLESLRAKLLSLLVLVFVVLLCVAAYHLTGMRAARLRHSTQTLLESAELIRTAGEVKLERAHAVLHSLLPLADIGRPAAWGTACHITLATALKRNTGVEDLFIAKPDGDVVCDAKRVSKTGTLISAPYIRAAMGAQEFVLGKPIPGTSSVSVSVPIAEPILNEAGRAQGVLTALVNLAWLRSKAVRQDLPSNSRLLIFDGHGDTIAHYPRQFSDAQARRVGSILSGVAEARQAGVIDVQVLGDARRLYAFVPLVDSVSGKFFLGIGVPDRGITAPANDAYIWGAVVALVVLTLSFGLVWFGLEFFVLRRVAALSHAAKQLAEGNVGARTGVKPARDELGMLACSFDAMAEDLQRRQESENVVKRTLARTNRALQVLSHGNRALVRATNEKALLEQMCRVLVEVGGYRMAWVGLAEHDEQKSIRPVAYQGFVKEYLDTVVLTWAQTEGGRGLSATAIRSGAPAIVRNVQAEPSFAPWRAEARKLGYESTVALPLKTGDNVLGVLRVYAREANGFDADEVDLLAEAAQDLAFGMMNLRAGVMRARLERSLQKTEEQLRAAAQGSLDAFCILRPVLDSSGEVSDLELVDVNPKAEALLKKPRASLVGETLRKVLPFYYDEVMHRCLPTLTTGKALEEQFSVRAPKGRTVWVRQQAVPLADGVAVFWRDITEGMEASIRLKASEKKYRELLESLQEGIWAVDVDARTTFVNAPLAQMLGYSLEEMVGRTVYDFLTANYAEGFKRQFLQRKQGIRHSYELGLLRKDGAALYCTVEGSPLYDDEGNFIGSLAGLVDITERRENELALARANRALKTISAANEELVRATNEEQLLQAVCRVIVKEGNYPKAWVGYAEDDPAKSITPKAWAGQGVETLVTNRRISWDARRPEGQGLAARVVRTAQPLVSQDVSTDPKLPFSREVALASGSRSVLVLPLLAQKDRALGMLSIHGNQAGLFDDGHVGLLRQLADDLSYGIESLRAKAERDRIAFEHLHHAEILRRRLMQSVEAIAATVEMRDPYTAGHQKRVAELAAAIAKELRIPEEKVEGIYLVGVVHDLGKIAVPAEILNKPGRLTEVEFALISQHSEAGYEILKGIEFPWPIAEIVRQHHERLDGSGYPRRLKDGAILPEARILAVADVVEAIASHRPYRPSIGIGAALQEIERGKGTVYDAAVVEACLRLFRERRFAFEGERIM